MSRARRIEERAGRGARAQVSPVVTPRAAALTRRRVLRGLAGVTVALPFLETFAPKKARAADYAPYAVFIRQANGVVQATGDEPELFFPSATGALTSDALVSEGRALSVLADYADRMLVLRGVNFAFPGNGCGHSGGGNQCLTAARVSDDPSGNESLAMGESIDNRIARELQAAPFEPLTLYAGKKAGYIDEVLSYRGPLDLRPAEDDPYVAYQKLFGLSTLPPEALEKLRQQRKSVNDLVRGEMEALLSRGDLSKADRDRLDLHFSAIRDLEVDMACNLPPDEVSAMEALSGQVNNGDYLIQIAHMQSDIIALAMACGVVRAATLQLGDGNDSTEYTIGGVKQYSYHWISHRIQGDGEVGAPIENAYLLHHEIDKLHGEMVKYLCDKLASYTLGAGTLLDAGVVVWLNDLGNKYHSYTDVPHVLVGGCGGALVTGRYVDLGGVNNNRLWNTVGTAVGCTDGAGGPLVDFGDPSLEGGVLTELLT